jgi:hypothetical protein
MTHEGAAMRLAVASIIASLLASFVACRHDAGELDPNVQRSDPAVRAVSPSRDLTPLLARLAYEAHHRTAVRLSAERVLDALDRAQLRIIERKQFLGALVHASYCLGGRTGAGLAIAACEYEDPAAAEAGKELMDRHFSAMAPWARRSAHGAIVLTIADPSGLAHDELAAHAFEVFAAL